MQQDHDFPFTVGSVLGKGFGLFFKNLIPILIMGAIIYAPLFLYALLSKSPYEAESLDELNSIALRLGLVIAGGGLLLGMIMTSAVTYSVVEELNGRHAPIGKSLSVGLARMLPTLGIGIVVVLLIALGLVALIIPGLIVMCILYVAIPASVIERPGLGGALSRSAFLTKGFRWQIFGIIFLLGLIERAMTYIVENVIVGKGELGIIAPDEWKLYLYLLLGVVVLHGAISATVNAAAYVALRREKDGVGVGELARVFE